MRPTAIVTIVAGSVWVSGAPLGASHSSIRAATIAAPQQRWCWDRVELRALACSGKTARRSGDTLYVRLANGRELSFIDIPDGESTGGYHYVGRIRRPPLQVVQQYGHEGPASWRFVNERTGRSTVANDEPVMSPDYTRFVTAAQPDWNNCVERNRPSLDIWRFTDTLPVLEWRLAPWDCRRRAGWGPTNPRWHGPDTLEFIRNEQPATDAAAKAPLFGGQRGVRAFSVHDRGGWRVLAP